MFVLEYNQQNVKLLMNSNSVQLIELMVVIMVRFLSNVIQQDGSKKILDCCPHQISIHYLTDK
jgi:hypothetical protein